MSIVTSFIICIFLYAWLEYFVHRFDMHNKGSYRFESHTIEHHGQMNMGISQANLTQQNVGIGFRYTLPLSLILGWNFLICWALFLFWAGFTWTAVHRNIHGEKGYWYAYLLCPWLPIVKWNHLRHHKNPKRGFGGMFWFLTDPIMGTL